MDSVKNRLYVLSAAHFAPVAEVPIPEHIEANRVFLRLPIGSNSLSLPPCMFGAADLLLITVSPGLADLEEPSLRY